MFGEGFYATNCPMPFGVRRVPVSCLRTGARCSLFDEQGRLVRMIGKVADITERNRVEEALRASQELLQAIWNHSPASIFIKDRQGHYLDLNPLFSNLTSLPREQIIGKTDEEIFPPEQAAA